MSGTDHGETERPAGGNSLPADEMRRIRNLLDEITRFAEHASLTGALSGGGRQAVKQYNAIVRHLREGTAFPPYLTVDVGDDASLDEVGFAARMLSGYLRPDDTFGPFSGIGDLREVKELKELGQRIRERMPDWLPGGAGQGDREAGDSETGENEA